MTQPPGKPTAPEVLYFTDVDVPASDDKTFMDLSDYVATSNMVLTQYAVDIPHVRRMRIVGSEAEVQDVINRFWP